MWCGVLGGGGGLRMGCLVVLPLQLQPPSSALPYLPLPPTLSPTSPTIPPIHPPTPPTPCLGAHTHRVMAVCNLLASPFLLVFLLTYFFMKNAEQFYHHPSSVGAWVGGWVSGVSAVTASAVCRVGLSCQRPRCRG